MPWLYQKSIPAYPFMTSNHSVKRLSTSQLLRKTGIPCLRRHKLNGRYYALKKIARKIKQEALRTATNHPIADRKIAERRLREWLRELTDPKPLNNCSFHQLLEKHRAVNAGMEQKTENNVEWMIQKLEHSWGKLNIPVSEITTSQVGAWLAAQTGIEPAT